MIRSAALLASLFALCLSAGCQKVSTLPVSGRVVQNEQPVPYSVVQFTPMTQQGTNAPTVTMVAQKGQFSSDTADSAITPGENRVTVTIPGAGEESLPTEYAFTINVPDQGDANLVLDLAQGKKQ